RLGVTNTLIINKDSRYFFDSGCKYDKILLDAPCSGNFCIEPDYYKKRSLTDVNERAKLQKELIRSASKLLKDKGILIYSTCSLEVEENEGVIDWAIKNLNLKLAKIENDFADPGFVKVFKYEF